MEVGVSELKKAGSVILGDLKMFNEAAVHLENEISPAFMEAIGDCFEEWGEGREWHVEVDLEEYHCWLAPQSWCFEDKKGDMDANPWFALDFDVNEDEGGDYLLASLCGIGANVAALYFGYDLGRVTKKLIKQAANASRDKYDEKLRALGFVFNEEYSSYYLPLKLDASLLASAWEQEDYEQFLQPLNAALDIIEKAAPTFEALFNDIQASREQS